MSLARAALVLVLANAGCGYSFPEVPDFPEHDKEEGGAMHARRLETPFLCGDMTNPEELEDGVPCPEDNRPPDFFVSCDAAGCHGNFDFTSSTAVNRQLWGNEGPSCYTCHGNKWDDD